MPRPFNRLLLLLLLSVAAVAQAAEGELLVGFAQDHLANDWRQAQVRVLQRGLEGDERIRFIYTDAGGSTARQIRDIEDLIHRGVDVLVTSPRDSVAMTPVVRQAYQQGIAVILLTRQIESEDYTSFISPNDAAIARQAARYLGEHLDGQGRVLILQGVPGATTTQQRTDAFIDTLAQEYPQMQIAGIRVANYLRNEAIRAMEEVYREGLAFDAIYAQSDSMASGARLAMQVQGIDPASVPTVGIDYIGEAREAILAGTQLASFTYPTSAEEAAELIIRLADGEDIPTHMEVPSQLVDIDNIHDVEPIF